MALAAVEVIAAVGPGNRYKYLSSCSGDVCGNDMVPAEVPAAREEEMVPGTIPVHFSLAMGQEGVQDIRGGAGRFLACGLPS